jgi:hypothetical protein
MGLVQGKIVHVRNVPVAAVASVAVRLRRWKHRPSGSAQLGGRAFQAGQSSGSGAVPFTDDGARTGSPAGILLPLGDGHEFGPWDFGQFLPVGRLPLGHPDVAQRPKWSLGVIFFLGRPRFIVLSRLRTPSADRPRRVGPRGHGQTFPHVASAASIRGGTDARRDWHRRYDERAYLRLGSKCLIDSKHKRLCNHPARGATDQCSGGN